MSDRMAKAREKLRLIRLNQKSQSEVIEEKKTETNTTPSIISEKLIQPEKEETILPTKTSQNITSSEDITPIPETTTRNSTKDLPLEEENRPQKKKMNFKDLFIVPSHLEEDMEIITERPVPRTSPNFAISQYAKLKPNLINPSHPNKTLRPHMRPSSLQSLRQNKDNDESDSEEEQPPKKKAKIDETKKSQPISTSTEPSPGIMERLGGMYNSIPTPIRNVANTYGPNVLVAVGSGVFLFLRAILQKWSHQASVQRIHSFSDSPDNRVNPTNNQLTQGNLPTVSPHIPVIPQGNGDYSGF